MKSRALDSSGDWQFGRGVQSYKSDVAALKQNISTRLKSWKNDCFFAMDDGVDWANYLDIGMKTYLDVDIRRVILQTAGVLRLDDYSSTLDATARKVTISCKVLTVFGSTVVEEAV